MLKKLFVVSSMLLMAMPVMADKPANPGFSLPANAVEVAPNVYSLGKAYDVQSHGIVEGYAIVHKKGNAKSNAAKGGPKALTCYGFLADGARWKVLGEAWQLNPAGSGLSGSYLLSNTNANIQKWENAAGTNVFGSGQQVSGTPTDKTVLDNKNEVSFGPISNSSTIAVTTVWGVFSGPTLNRRLVEWDQVYNNTDYTWSDSGAAGMMDFENISTHELGHAIGMDDMYQSACGNATMYGYATEGETAKRSLESPDTTGVFKLYH